MTLDQTYVVAADGGNSKTDLVLATDRGDLLARVQGGGTRPHIEGMPATIEALAELTRRAVAEAGLPTGTRIAVGSFYLANVDLPDEEAVVLAGLRRLAVAEQLEVRNDVFAVLRAGSSRDWGVAVVAGAGINAVGVHPNGREERFLALGDVSGDWGGGYSVGLAGLGAAVRAGDGRGPATVLRELLPRRFGDPDPETMAIRLHREPDAERSLLALAPVVFSAASAGDPVACRIVERLADEVSNLATALLRRLALLGSDADVVLGGGTLQSGNGPLLDRIRSQLAVVAPNVVVRVLDTAPVTGAVARALDLAGAPATARERARAALRQPAG
ncbi:MAG TPA: BadF/BadG/BcrA/BcrD ATPase family protein [Jatrophihabitans sp.]|nr:BadF/BadG/BcrA/BcrD ATPase family protein [Jatrophihabitans sp.]